MPKVCFAWLGGYFEYPLDLLFSRVLAKHLLETTSPLKDSVVRKSFSSIKVCSYFWDHVLLEL